MKPLIFALCVVFAFGGLSAQKSGWQPSPGHTQLPIWPGAVPDAQPVAGPEVAVTAKGLIPGKSGDIVENVSRPTMTVYSPSGKNTGAAVVVFPGGGYSSARPISGSRHRSGRYGGLRLADVQGDRVCAVEVPCAGFGAGVAR